MYTVHVIQCNIDGGATEADGGASAPVGPSVATPLRGIDYQDNEDTTVPINFIYCTV